MAVPVLSLNLAPRPSLWRQRHRTLGWAALAFGAAVLLGSIGFTWRAYHQADRAGRDAVSLTEEARRASRQEQLIQASLQEMDAAKEQARWKLAERILQERALPWSRLTAELEQCMVPDMRLKGLQRARSSAQQVVLKLKAEARTREAEAAFVEALRGTPVFAQVVLERESERNGGGWDFEITLPAAAVPPPFKLKAINQTPAGQAPVAARTPVAAAKLGRPVAVALPQPVKPIRPTQPAPGLAQPALGRPAAGMASQPPQPQAPRPTAQPSSAAAPPPPQAAPAPPPEEEETGRVRQTRIRPTVPRPPR
ncbi:MAG: PilN domain-containing protein [Geothrix sp.]